ncbi:MAG: hypothetical protein WCI95_10975 [bacterium]
MSNVEIICTACGQESLLKRGPKFDGFKKVGEALTCASCGHEYADEAEVPFKQRRKPKVFDASDASPVIKVFDETEAERLCRHCKHYVVNPFVQRCGKHGKVVEATDTCRDFEKKILPKK